jgi:hypothetical protein
MIINKGTKTLNFGMKVKAKDLMLILDFVQYAVEMNQKDLVIDWSKLPPALHETAEGMIDHRMTVLACKK